MRWDEYAKRWAALHGGFDPRAAGQVVRGWLRLAYGIGALLARWRVPPTVLAWAPFSGGRAPDQARAFCATGGLWRRSARRVSLLQVSQR